MTQNQGNQLGDRPCVRQSKLFRQHDAGNAMKDLMGHSHLNWKTDVQEGAYAGKRVFDHNAPNSYSSPQQQQPQQQSRQQPQQQQYQQAPQQQQYQQAPQQQQYQQQQYHAPAPMVEQQVNQQQTQAKPRGRGGYHNNPRDAGFNFFTGEAH